MSAILHFSVVKLKRDSYHCWAEKQENDLNKDSVFDSGKKSTAEVQTAKCINTNEDRAWPASFDYGGVIHSGFTGTGQRIAAFGVRERNP